MNSPVLNERFWSWVGRVAAVLGVLWLLVQLKDRLWSPVPLAVTGVAFEAHLPPDLQNFLRATASRLDFPGDFQSGRLSARASAADDGSCTTFVDTFT